MPDVMLWVEALSTIRARADEGRHGPMRYRVRGLPADRQISIVKDATGAWRIDRNDGADDAERFETPNAALAYLQAEFDRQHPTA